MPWLILIAVSVLGAIAIPQNWRRRLAAVPFSLGVVLLAIQWNAPAGIKLLAASMLMLLLVKVAALYARRGTNAGAWLLPYLAPWPGVDPEPFQRKESSSEDEPKRFAAGWGRMWIGAVLFSAVVYFSPALASWAVGTLAILAVLVMVHLGFSDMLTAVYRLFGWKVDPAFDEPWKAKSLLELWSRRWNRPFVEMNQLLLIPWANRVIGRRRSWIIAFVASGVLHEMAITYPAGGGYGLPLSYFLIQAALIAVERRYSIRGSWWALLAFIIPVPLLFPPVFLDGVIAPLIRTLHTMASDWMSSLQPETLVVALGIVSLAPVIASAQVPTKLRWREEFGKLTGLNRRIVWVYGSYVLAMIIGLGAFLVFFSQEIVSRERAAVGVVGFAALFWAGRIIVDAVAFREEDWPSGPALAIGRRVLHTLFLVLAGFYVGLFVWLVT